MQQSPAYRLSFSEADIRSLELDTLERLLSGNQLVNLYARFVVESRYLAKVPSSHVFGATGIRTIPTAIRVCRPWLQPTPRGTLVFSAFSVGQT